MSYNYNYRNVFCDWCSELVYKGEGVFHNFRGGFVLCKECNASREKNLEKAKKKRKFKKNQLNLFD